MTASSLHDHLYNSIRDMWQTVRHEDITNSITTYYQTTRNNHSNKIDLYNISTAEAHSQGGRGAWVSNGELRPTSFHYRASIGRERWRTVGLASDLGRDKD